MGFSLGKLRRLLEIPGILLRLPQNLEEIRLALGQLHLRVDSLNPGGPLPSDHEFRVFSQWGEDGIIQHLASRLPGISPTFVELGVENYLEANTRFLALGLHWKGLIVDGSEANIRFVQCDPVFWKSHLRARCAFISRENINEILSSEGVRGRLGLLSIDLDGNDYWIWEAISDVEPEIVVCEYNALFGPSVPVSVPYDPSFVRSGKHHSHLYFGASLAALEHLAIKKNYRLVDVNKAGGNAFFVRSDCLATSGLQARSAAECFRPPVFRESRDKEGRLTCLDWESARDLLKRAQLPLVNVVKGETVQTSIL